MTQNATVFRMQVVKSYPVLWLWIWATFLIHTYLIGSVRYIFGSRARDCHIFSKQSILSQLPSRGESLQTVLPVHILITMFFKYPYPYKRFGYGSGSEQIRLRSCRKVGYQNYFLLIYFEKISEFKFLLRETSRDNTHLSSVPDPKS